MERLTKGRMSMIMLELKKLRRCSMIWVGVVTMVCAPLLAILQQISMNEPLENYGFSNLINVTVWYNMGLFMPVTLTLIGGYMMHREYVDDMLKSLFTIPVSYKRLMLGKLLALLVLAVLYSVYSFVVTTILSRFFFPIGLTGLALFHGFLQIVGMGICLCVAVLPIVAWCGGRKNRFFAGSILAFLYGFFSIPIAGHNLQDYYPVSAGLSIIRYSGDTGSANISYNPAGAFVLLLIMVAVSYVILCLQNLNK